MIVKGVKAYQINALAYDCGFKADPRPKGNWVRFRLYPTSDYQRKISKNLGRHRRVNAVCWHGHRDFMEKLFHHFPYATLKTALATYKGKEDFESKFLSTGFKNVGSNFTPVWFVEACDCNSNQ